VGSRGTGLLIERVVGFCTKIWGKDRTLAFISRSSAFSMLVGLIVKLEGTVEKGTKPGRGLGVSEYLHGTCGNANCGHVNTGRLRFVCVQKKLRQCWECCGVRDQMPAMKKLRKLCGRYGQEWGRTG